LHIGDAHSTDFFRLFFVLTYDKTKNNLKNNMQK
jgi:hypothetical protein